MQQPYLVSSISILVLPFLSLAGSLTLSTRWVYAVERRKGSYVWRKVVGRGGGVNRYPTRHAVRRFAVYSRLWHIRLTGLTGVVMKGWYLGRVR
jgi:hypothetical protein